MVTVGLAVPASGMSELETLRERCAQQDRQIRRLKTENERLREGKSDGSATSARSTKEADSTKSTKSAKTATPKSETKTDPPKSTTSRASKTASSGGSGGGTYTVRQGDSFDRIAHKNGTSAEKVAEANNLELTAIIHPGQKLILPAKGSSRSPSAGRSTAHTTDPAVTRPPPDPKPVKQPAVADDNPSVADAPPDVPKAAATTGAGRSPAASLPATKTVDNKKTHAVKIEKEMTYGEFATKHGTNTKSLNDLNGLALAKSAVLAKGSIFYVPGQP